MQTPVLQKIDNLVTGLKNEIGTLGRENEILKDQLTESRSLSENAGMVKYLSYKIKLQIISG